MKQALLKTLHVFLITALVSFGLTLQQAAPLQANPRTPAADPDLTISKSASSDLLIVGQPLTYTMLVRNVGTISTTNVVITDPIPTGLGIAYGAAECIGPVGCALNIDFIGRTMSVTVNSIGLNDLVTVTAVVTPIIRGLITNTVYIASASPEITTTNNIATKTVLVAGMVVNLPIVTR